MEGEPIIEGFLMVGKWEREVEIEEVTKEELAWGEEEERAEEQEEGKLVRGVTHGVGMDWIGWLLDQGNGLYETSNKRDKPEVEKYVPM